MATHDDDFKEQAEKAAQDFEKLGVIRWKYAQAFSTRHVGAIGFFALGCFLLGLALLFLSARDGEGSQNPWSYFSLGLLWTAILTFFYIGLRDESTTAVRTGFKIAVILLILTLVILVGFVFIWLFYAVTG